MTEEHGSLAEDVAAYALGSLDRAEGARLAAHLESCGECARLLSEYHAVVAALPVGLDPIAPPDGAWTAIRTASRARRPAAASPGSRGWPWRWFRAAAWPAVAAALAVLVLWNVGLQRELARRSPGPAPGPEVEALSRRPGRVVTLEGTGQSGASARIFVAVDGGGHLAVSGLPPLRADRSYQVWFMRAARPVSGATFRVDASGRAWVKVSVPPVLHEVTAILVTEEPAIGSAAPTGRELLAARPWP